MSEKTTVAKNSSKEYLIFAILLILFCGYLVCDVFFAGRTSRSTANGVWRAPSVAAWAEEGSGQILSYMTLYYPLVGKLIHLFDSSPYTPYTFQKMAAVNALLGGCASAAFFLIAYAMTRRLCLSAVAALCHFSLGFVLLLSTISEAIMLAYFFYVYGVLFLLRWLETQRYVFLVLFSCCFSLAWMSHWLFAVGIVAVVVVSIALGQKMIRDKLIAYGVAILVFFVSFVVVGRVLLHVPVTSVVFPGYGLGSGWGGFKLFKVPLLIVGASYYFVGGFNVYNLQLLTTNGTLLFAFLLGLGLTLLALFGVVWSIVKEKGSIRVLLLALLAAFLMTEGMNLYTQPQDPQTQIQPMLLLSVSMVLSARTFLTSEREILLRRSTVLLCGCLFVFVNVRFLWESAGTDKLDIDKVNALVRAIDVRRSFVLVQGFDDFWLAYYYAMVDSKMWVRAPRNVFGVSEIPVGHPKFTPTQIGKDLSERMKGARAAGYDILVDRNLWNYSQEGLFTSLASVASRSQTDALYNVIHSQMTIASEIRLTPTFVLERVNKVDSPQ